MEHPSNEDIEAVIIELTFKWFPFLKRIVQQKGTIFGGFLREMWSAARSYTPYGSLSFRDTICPHMFNYIKNGGDVDFSMEKHAFEKVTRIELYSNSRDTNPIYPDENRSRPYNLPEDVTQIERIESVECGYELESIIKNINSNREYEIREEYGGIDVIQKEIEAHQYKSDDDESTRRWKNSCVHQLQTLLETATTETIFPTTHYKLSVRADICSELGGAQLVPVDLITYYRGQEPAPHCDFGCNLLTLCYDNDRFKITPQFHTTNCTSMIDFDQQVCSRELTVLKTEHPHKPIKIIRRVAIRLQDKWTISTDQITKEILVENLCCAINTRGGYHREEDPRTKAMIMHDDELIAFIRAKGPEMFQIFMAIRDELVIYINKEIDESLSRCTARGENPLATFRKKPNYRNMMDVIGYGVQDLLRYLLTTSIQNGQYTQFVTWSKQVKHWNPQYYDNLMHTVQYAPQYIPQMFNLCPIKTNGDVLDFITALVEYDREAELLHFLKMPAVKPVINGLNTLSEEERGNKKICSGFFREYISSSYKPFAAKYMPILHAHGVRFPRPEAKKVIYSETELLRFLWKQKLINKNDVFPPKDESKKYYEQPDILQPTAANLLWLLEVTKVTDDDICRLADKFTSRYHMPDLQFLTEYKKVCISRGLDRQAFPQIFKSAYERDDLNDMQHYFQYRFDTIWPDIAEVSAMPITADRYSYHSARVGTIVNCDKNVIKTMVRHYGPHVVLGAYEGQGYNAQWFILTYWLWRISRRQENPIAAAWGLPKDVVDIILNYIQAMPYCNESSRYMVFERVKWIEFRRNVRK